MVAETFRTIKRTFRSKKSLSIATLLELKITAKSQTKDIEKAIEVLFKAYDCDNSNTISKEEYKLFGKDLAQIIDKECFFMDTDTKNLILNGKLQNGSKALFANGKTEVSLKEI
jgi:hypothetical protein